MAISRRDFVQTAAAMGAAVAWGGSAKASLTNWREARAFYPEGVASGDPASTSVILWSRRPFAEGAQPRKSATVTISGLASAFLVMRSQIDHEDFPDGVAMFGSDNKLGTITMCWFDERGISGLCPVSVSPASVSWHHDDPKFMQRVVITADPDGRRMVSHGEMATDGGPWGEDLSQVFIRK
jgi:hypothetical protein